VSPVANTAARRRAVAVLSIALVLGTTTWCSASAALGVVAMLRLRAS
jgi:hypothetical protein